MKLTVDLSALHSAVAPLGKVITDFSISSQASELVSISDHLSKGLELGKDIQLNEISGSDGILHYEGHQVMLYIPDQGNNIELVLEDGKQGRRIHVAECRTLHEMREKGRFQRYDVINRVDGMFPVFGRDKIKHTHMEGETDLAVCKNCLTVLNYKGFETENYASRNKVFNEFNYEVFFEVYSSYFKSLPVSTSKKQGDYTADWAAISATLRSELNHTCQQCGVNLSADKKLLHTHHINGNKTDNGAGNLRVLCADCHKKQPHHEHLYVSNEQTLKINQRRREQHKFDVFNYDNLRGSADTALDGLLRKCETMRLPGAELGISITLRNESIPIDLCWPRRKVAVLINMQKAQALLQSGWTVFSAFDALNDFENFQRQVR